MKVVEFLINRMSISNLLEKIILVYESPIILINRISGFYHYLWFVISARIHGTTIEIGNEVKFGLPTIVQGFGAITLENNVTFGYWMGGSQKNPILLQPRESSSSVYIGTGTVIMNGCEFFCFESIRVGKNCLIGAKTTFLDSDVHGINPNKRNQLGATAPITIGDNVWFGIEATVLKGVNIGKDSIIGACCVVTRDVADGSIVVGNPMKVIGSVWDKKYI